MNEQLTDLAPEKFLLVGCLALILALTLAIALLPKKHARAQRALALLAAFITSLAALTQLLPLALGSGLSLLVFLGIFALFHFLGKFESRD
ncbi:MAG TPA: hypothetical protein VIH99_01195 [Bdellovibrionota bacterium]|jgi:hypothetical protein